MRSKSPSKRRNRQRAGQSNVRLHCHRRAGGNGSLFSDRVMDSGDFFLIVRVVLFCYGEEEVMSCVRYILPISFSFPDSSEHNERSAP